MFNPLLLEAGLDLKDVRLLRHANSTGRSAYELWREDRDGFNLYQSVQAIDRRPDFGSAGFWASFGSTLDGETVFLGLYEVSFRGVGRRNLKKPHTAGVNRAGTYHRYDMKECAALQDLAGRLYVDWGAGTRVVGLR